MSLRIKEKKRVLTCLTLEVFHPIAEPISVKDSFPYGLRLLQRRGVWSLIVRRDPPRLDKLRELGIGGQGRESTAGRVGKVVRKGRIVRVDQRVLEDEDWGSENDPTKQTTTERTQSA